MALREKFGRLVLLEETDSGPLGNEYRAARLGPSGFDRLVSVLRFSPAVSAHAEASKRLVEEARLAAQVHSPGLIRALGVGRVGASFYLSTELVEGRTLRAVLARCRDEGFPFAVDHALMIASRAAAGLELLHGRRDDAGRWLLHGLITPRQLVAVFDGEVKIKGLGLWSALGDTELLAPEERTYLAPEQATARGDPRSDVYALGLVLLEALSGQAPDGSDPLERIDTARLPSPDGEPSPFPGPLADLLRQALDSDPAARFQGMPELRRAIDALLFSGDFTPTTFDLAFFMHTLYRDEVERDARAIDDARAGDYREFLSEDAAKPAPLPPAQTEPVDARSPAPDVTDALAALRTETPAPVRPGNTRPSDPVPQAPRAAAGLGPDSSGSRMAARASRDGAAREAAGRLSLAGGPARRAREGRSLWLVLGVIAAVVVGGGAGWLYFVSQRRGTIPPQAPSAVPAASDERVRELEARIAELEREKAAAEVRAADDARLTVERQAAAGGQPADPVAIERAQEEARRRARLEQEHKQQEELQRLADEKRVEQQRLTAATPAPTPLPVPTLTAPATATPPPVAEISPAAPSTPTTPGPSTEPAFGGLASLQGLAPAATPTATPSPSPAPPAAADPNDPAVRPPTLISEDAVPYPARAVPRRIATVVVVQALVDERGMVVEATVTQSSGQPAELGFDEAALKRVRSRKYRPARRNDVPVPIWVVVRLDFRPPPLR